MNATFRLCLTTFALLVAVSPAAAQWSRALDVQASDIFSLWTSGDTIAAGADTAVYVSTNAGATWRRSARVTTGATQINAVWVRNGRIYAGTFGQGVFVSNDLGNSWLGINQGLGGGFADTQLNIQDLLVRGDSLYAATEGGAWVRNLAVTATWSHFGNAFEANSASAMLAIAANDTRLVAAAGFNGQSFYRDRGDANWTEEWINGVGPLAGLPPLSVLWTGRGWVMGTSIGTFVSATGLAPWTRTGPHVSARFFLPIAHRGSDVFANFGSGEPAVIEFSSDDGHTWQELEQIPLAFIYKFAVVGADLYAARTDGLWHRSIAAVSVPDGAPPTGLRFAIAGSQPVGDDVRFQFDLPEAGPVTIEVFDIAGRRAGESIHGVWAAGPHEITWNARGLGPGVFLARLTAGREYATVRAVRIM